MLKNILLVTIFDTKLIVRNVALYMDPKFCCLVSRETSHIAIYLDSFFE